jgi:hypothetical protein
MSGAEELTDIEPDDATVDPRAKISYDVRERCGRRVSTSRDDPARQRSVRAFATLESRTTDDGRRTTETDRTRATIGV